MGRPLGEGAFLRHKLQTSRMASTEINHIWGTVMEVSAGGFELGPVASGGDGLTIRPGAHLKLDGHLAKW